MKEGDILEVLAVLADGVSVVCRTEDGSVGNYNLNYLLTHEQVLAAHEEQAKTEQAEEARRKREAEAERQAEEERSRMKNMLNKAKDDARERQRQFEEAQVRLEEARVGFFVGRPCGYCWRYKQGKTDNAQIT